MLGPMPDSLPTSAFHADALVWDAHSCLPLKPGIDIIPALERHRRAGVDFVSINVGMDFNPSADVLSVLEDFRRQIGDHPDRLALAGTAAEVEEAGRQGKLAIAFDLEGSDMLDGDLEMLHRYRDLGVRQMHLAYNRDNAVGGGCHGADIGLTAFGRKVVAEINALGILMDCSHTGHRTSLEVMEMSTRPVVFSHANARALVDHPRNISDEQAKACAATGGVVGVTGVGLFLGDPAAGTAAMVRQVEYLSELVGPSHVGIGLDFVFIRGVDDDPPGFDPSLWWPADADYTGFDRMAFATPEQLPELTEALLAGGHGEAEVRGILGGNFLRAAKETWPPHPVS